MWLHLLFILFNIIFLIIINCLFEWLVGPFYHHIWLVPITYLLLNITLPIRPFFFVDKLILIHKCWRLFCWLSLFYLIDFCQNILCSFVDSKSLLLGWNLLLLFLSRWCFASAHLLWFLHNKILNHRCLHLLLSLNHKIIKHFIFLFFLILGWT